jgi:hypothetical protein
MHGNLLLKVSQDAQYKWQCAEVYLSEPLGYGSYTFEITGINVAIADPYYVLGLFSYYNDSREIDAEFSRWGNNSLYANNANFANQPTTDPANLLNYYMSANVLSYRVNYVWTPGSIVFTTTATDGTLFEQKWSRTGDSVPDDSDPLLVHLNLWLFRGHPPSTAATVTVKSFKFVSA